MKTQYKFLISHTAYRTIAEVACDTPNMTSQVIDDKGSKYFAALYFLKGVLTVRMGLGYRTYFTVPIRQMFNAKPRTVFRWYHLERTVNIYAI